MRQVEHLAALRDNIVMTLPMSPDMGHDSAAVISEMIEVFSIYGFSTKVIAASIRHPMHVTRSRSARSAGQHFRVAVSLPFPPLFSGAHKPPIINIEINPSGKVRSGYGQ